MGVETGEAPLSISRHVVLGAAAALVSLFTVFAWPFALVTGMVIGRAEADRARGIRVSTGTRLVQFLAVTGGVLAMLFFGALVGGLFAFLIVALAALSERIAATASETDRTIARIILLLVPAAVWVLGVALNVVTVTIKLGP